MGLYFCCIHSVIRGVYTKTAYNEQCMGYLGEGAFRICVLIADFRGGDGGWRGYLLLELHGTCERNYSSSS